MNLWLFTAKNTTNASTHAFHCHIIKVTEKQLQIALIVFLTLYPGLFFTMGSQTTQIVPAVVSSQSISSSTGDSCPRQHTNHSHLHCNSFVCCNKTQITKAQNRTRTQRPAWHTEKSPLCRVLINSLPSFYKTEQEIITESQDVSELRGFTALIHFRETWQSWWETSLF